MSRTARLTISLPTDLIAFADELAAEKKISRSRVVAACLREIADRRTVVEMEEGYRLMAEENRQLAEQSIPVALETWPEWGNKS